MDSVVDVFQIVGSLATAVALFFVARSTRHAESASKSMRDQLHADIKRDAEAHNDRVRRQANRVVSWPAIHNANDVPEWGIVVANNSDAPVFDVAVRRPAGRSQSKNAVIGAVEKKLSILPPGVYFFSQERSLPRLVGDLADMEPIVKNSDYMAEISFRDSRSTTWVRDKEGVLRP